MITSRIRVARRKLANDQHKAQIALMKFLSDVTRRERVGDHVYVVGGAVRNFLIDRPIKDIDVVIDTVGLGERFRKPRDSEWFAQTLQRVIPAKTDFTTNQYGVAILTVKQDWIVDGHNLKGEVIEIANARKESYGGGAGKGYKPDQVVPATIEEDLLRREFTFNTLLWRLQDVASGPEKAEVVDLTGCGLRDLNNMTMRCPRDPDIVFADDPTRMLRAIKFATKYGFKIPADLAASIRKNAPKMKKAPWEAISSIFINNVLNEPTAAKALRQMKSLGLLDVVAEMVQEQRPFATYLSKQLSNRNVSLLLDLLELGVTSPSPLKFLTQAQQARLREITVSMDSGDADAFAAYLAKPPVDNRSLIVDFNLQGPERALPIEYARKVLLENPDLMGNRAALDQAIRGLMQPKNAQRQASGGGPVYKQAKTYTRIAMYDFDGTLFKSWEQTPTWWEGSALDDRPYSFFVKPESLDEPCVPERPSNDYWINKVVREAQEDSRDRACLVVVVTGRVKTHKRRVLELLQSKGIVPDYSYFNPGMAAAKFKVAVLKNLVVGFNTIRKVDIWENENQTIYQTALESTAKKLGRDIEVTVHKIHEEPKPLVCGPEDFGLPSRVARRWASLRSAKPKKYENIDFKPPAGVAAEAEKGLKYRRESGKGGLSSQEAGKAGIGSGVQRAVNLKNRNNIAPDTIQQMLNFFSRHQKNKAISPEHRGSPENDAGYVAWLLWGGDAGLAWAKKVEGQMEAAEEKLAQKTAYRSDALDSGGIKVLPQGRWEIVSWSELSDYVRGSVWEIYDVSYGSIGKHVPNKAVFGKKYQYLYLIDVDDDIFPDAFIAHKITHAGIKIALGGTDGTRKAKKAMIQKMRELILQPGWYAEASHKVSAILESAGARPIDDEEVVRKTLKGKEIEWLGDGKYIRQLGSSSISAAKSLYGSPKV